MLMFTNRITQPGTDAQAFTRRFKPGSDALSMAEVSRQGGGFALGALEAATSDDAALQRLVTLFGGPQPVLLYLHGNSNPPAACFERCARLEEIYGVAVVGFSWPSEGLLSSGADLPDLDPGPDDADDGGDSSLQGVTAANRSEGWANRKIRRYRQAKVNAQDSTDALSRLLRLLATARLYSNAQRLNVAAHSLGCHLLQYTIELENAAASLAAAHNVSLLAACCRAQGHESWLRQIQPRGQVFVTYNAADLVLFGAAIADGNQIKLGTEPGSRLADPRVRYVSFTNANAGLGGHGYFVRDAGDKMPKIPRKLFSRVFAGERDIHTDRGEYPRKVYPAGCDASGVTCYMDQPEVGGGL